MKVWGTESERAYIYVHGMNGSKNDAEGFAGVAERFGYQVVSFDVGIFDPVNTLPELEGVGGTLEVAITLRCESRSVVQHGVFSR